MRPFPSTWIPLSAQKVAESRPDMETATQVTSISAGRATRNSPLVPRVRLNTEPFTAQQRDEVIVRFFYLRQSVSQIAAHFGTGYGPVQDTLRFGFFRAVGRRRSDRNERTAA